MWLFARRSRPEEVERFWISSTMNLVPCWQDGRFWRLHSRRRPPARWFPQASGDSGRLRRLKSTSFCRESPLRVLMTATLTSRGPVAWCLSRYWMFIHASRRARFNSRPPPCSAAPAGSCTRSSSRWQRPRIDVDNSRAYAVRHRVVRCVVQTLVFLTGHQHTSNCWLPAVLRTNRVVPG